ncbi:MAG: hypothetical protein JO243_13740 [Solirubrobacterales bacterium]|nr:hypothetical protein [Solirubrobacterales bacterium]
MRAGQLGELHREASDATARAGDEDALTQHEADDLEGAQRCQPRHRQRRGLLERDAVGKLAQVLDLDRRQLRPGARVHQPDHARAFGRTALCRRPTDDPGQVPAGDRPGLQCLEATRLAAVEAECFHLD